MGKNKRTKPKGKRKRGPRNAHQKAKHTRNFWTQITREVKRAAWDKAQAEREAAAAQFEEDQEGLASPFWEASARQWTAANCTVGGSSASGSGQRVEGSPEGPATWDPYLQDLESESDQ